MDGLYYIINLFLILDICGPIYLTPNNVQYDYNSSDYNEYMLVLSHTVFILIRLYGYFSFLLITCYLLINHFLVLYI